MELNLISPIGFLDFQYKFETIVPNLNGRDSIAQNGTIVPAVLNDILYANHLKVLGILCHFLSIFG